MVMNSNIKNLFLSIISASLFYFLLVYFWAYFPTYNPFFQWLLSCCAGSPWLRAVIHLQDIIVNTLLCIPLALLLNKISPRNVWPNVAVALLTMFLIGHYHLFLPEYWGWHINEFAFSWLIQLVPLPIAILFSRLERKRENT